MLSSQDIFHGTVRDNITMGNDNISDEEIFHLSKVTGLYGYILSLKKVSIPCSIPLVNGSLKNRANHFVDACTAWQTPVVIAGRGPTVLLIKQIFRQYRISSKQILMQLSFLQPATRSLVKVADRALHINEGKIVS